MKSSRAKKFLSLVLAVVMVLALAACGNKTNDDNNTNSDNNNATDFPTKPMTIVCPYGAGGAPIWLCVSWPSAARMCSVRPSTWRIRPAAPVPWA